jgi:hypothetical protein
VPLSLCSTKLAARTAQLQSILGYEADGGNENVMALRDRKSAHVSAAFDAEVTGFLCFIPTGALFLSFFAVFKLVSNTRSSVYEERRRRVQPDDFRRHGTNHKNGGFTPSQRGASRRLSLA